MTTLLLTKLYAPPRRPDYLSRPRLLARLAESQAYPLLVLSAPPGFGKTALLAEWVAQAERRFGWLSLEAADNDLITFWTYVVAALQTAWPGGGDGALTLLQGPQPPPIEIILTGLINDLAAAPQLGLVLDDYHAIESAPVQASLTFLVEHCPPALRLVVASRADPPLPLARWRARGQLAELRAADLRFAPEEAALLLQQAVKVPLTQAEVTTLAQRTEGWVAGLQLAALSLQGQAQPAEAIRAFSGSSRFVLDYLVGEVLQQQPPARQIFLLQTSLLQRLTGPLCDAVTGRDDGQATLEQLEQANLFIVPLDGERRWYRYHHLFADLLRHRLQAMPGSQVAAASQVAELHRRAAAWHAGQELIAEAIYHALLAGQAEQAAGWVEQRYMPLLARGELSTLRGWLEALPPNLGLARPRLGTAQAWLHMLTGQNQAAEASLQAAERAAAAPAPEDRELQGEIAALRTYAVITRGDWPAAETWARRALELLPDEAQSVRSFVNFTLGTAKLLTDDVAGAHQALAEANEQALAGGNLHLAFNTARILAVFLAEEGRLGQALAMCEDILRRATTPAGRVWPAAAAVCGTLGDLWYERNDLATAERYLAQAQDLGEKWGNADTQVASLLRWAWLCQVQHKAAEAGAALEQAARLAQQHQLTPGTPELIQYYQVRVWLAQGQLAPAERWARENQALAEGAVHFLRLAGYRALVLVFIALNRPAEALELLGRLCVWVEGHGLAGWLVSFRLLQALALKAQGAQTEALAALGQALRLAEPEGYTRTFVDEGEGARVLMADFRVLIEKYDADKGYGRLLDYVKRLLAAFPASEPVPPDSALNPQSDLFEPLTEREIELLRLIAGGLSNQAIAEKLVISVGTVKAHTSNIYRKLDVGTRTQAVARAREYHLL